MKEFYEPLAEIVRITEGKPGKVPDGKPRVTDGTLAGYKRETPKQVIQQLPQGKVIIKANRELEDQANAILTDIILPNANGGGTPYDKAILSIEDLIDSGSSWAYCYFDRKGNIRHANYRLKYVKDILFEKGKVSEFDANFLPMIEWMTETDIKALIDLCNKQKRSVEERGEKYESKYDLKAWSDLLAQGAGEKDDENKTEDEKKKSAQIGYFKVVKFMQVGVGATFYTYSPKLDRVLSTEINKDPRGIIPLHGLVGAPSRSNPLGRPLAAISVGKQNLLDFRMQMEQYREGMAISPPVKLWGNTPESKIKLVPDKIIKMNGNKQTDDFEAVDLATSANRNYANDSSYIRTQIYNEQGGSNDTSVSADAGSTGFSKTDSGVKQQQARTSVSKDHLRRLSENWHGRIFETLLNIHFAESQGVKELDLEDETLRRMNMTESPVMDYDQDFGKIKFTVTPGTSQAEDNQQENEKLIALLDIKSKYGSTPDQKTMLMINQIIKNSGVDDPEKLMYTDEEIEYQKQQEDMAKQMAEQQAQMQHEKIMNPQPTVGQPPLPPQALEPADVDPAIEEDRAIAMQQLIDSGATPEEAEIILQDIDRGEL